MSGRFVPVLTSIGLLTLGVIVPLALDAQAAEASGSQSCASPSGHSFSDVPPKSYYNIAVGWLVGAETSAGTSPERFSPDQQVTRAQMSVFLWRAAGEPTPQAGPGFSDVPPLSYYATGVAWLVEVGITGGTGPGVYSPDQIVTRAQMAMFLFRSSCGSNVAGTPDISAGGQFVCAIVSAGGLKCWGNGVGGQLGDGAGVDSATPVSVSGLSSGVVKVAAGASHACALLTDTTVKCWGIGDDGRLGDNTEFDRPTPVGISGLTGVLDIAAGGSHSCAVISGGTVKCWGLNHEGQVGDGTFTNRPAPVAVSGLTGVLQVEAGQNFTCARLSNGTVKCWGRNYSGSLGDGTQTDRNTPVTVSGLSGVSSLALGAVHACAVLNDGTVKCWGSNSNGQLADGEYENSRAIPVTAEGVSGATTIGAGFSRTCVTLSAGGTAKCWGENTFGGLGDGTTTSRPMPTSVANLSGATTVTLGSGPACVRLAGGGARCWGLNDVGQVGDGT